MINWAQICPVLVQTITSIATDQLPAPSPSWKAEWSDRHRDYIHPEQELALYLKITSVTPIQEDEDRYDYDETADEVTVTQSGLRRIVLNLQAECSEDTDEPKHAINTLERIRTRMRRQSVIDALLAVDVALIAVGTTQNLAATFDQRVWSIANLDVTLCAAVNDADPVPAGQIARVVISSTFAGITNAEIPPA